MQPSEAARHVVPSDVRHLVYRRTVVAGKEGQKQLVPFVNGPVQFGINVIEVERIVSEVL